MKKGFGVIFDIDGVLVDSAELHLRAWEELGKELGISFSREFFDSVFGQHNNAIIPRWVGRSLTEDEYQSIVQRKEELFRFIAQKELKAMPGAVELVRELHEAPFLLAIGSSAPQKNVAFIMELLGITPFFDAVSSGDDVRHGKPDPEVFLVAARKLGLASTFCVVIEDAPQGIEAALRAGSKVVALTSSRPREELRQAQLIVDSLSELSPAVLQKILE